MNRNAGFAIAMGLAIALAGCGKKEEASAPADTGSSVAAASEASPAASATLAPGNYEVFGADGKSVGKTEIRADGGYTDTPPKGLPTSGVVKLVDGKTCFDPSGNAGPTCYTESAPGADGSFTATDDKGVVLTVRPAS